MRENATKKLEKGIIHTVPVILVIGTYLLSETVEPYSLELGEGFELVEIGFTST